MEGTRKGLRRIGSTIQLNSMIGRSNAAIHRAQLTRQHLTKSTSTSSNFLPPLSNSSYTSSNSTSNSISALELPHFLCPALDPSSADTTINSSPSTSTSKRTSSSKTPFKIRFSSTASISNYSIPSTSKLRLDSIHSSTSSPSQTRSASSSSISTSVPPSNPRPSELISFSNASQLPIDDSTPGEFSVASPITCSSLLQLTSQSSSLSASPLDPEAQQREAAETVSMWQLEMDESIEDTRRKEMRITQGNRGRRKEEKRKKEFRELTRRTLSMETGIENEDYLNRREEIERREEEEEMGGIEDRAASSQEDLESSWLDEPSITPKKTSAAPIKYIRKNLFNFLRSSKASNQDIQLILESCRDIISKPSNETSQQMAFASLEAFRTVNKAKVHTFNSTTAPTELQLASQSLLLILLHLNNRVALQAFFSLLSTLSTSNYSLRNRLWPMPRSIILELVQKLGRQKRFRGVLKLCEIEKRHWDHLNSSRGKDSYDSMEDLGKSFKLEKIRAQSGLFQWKEIVEEHLSSFQDSSEDSGGQVDSSQCFHFLLRSSMRLRDVGMTNLILKKMGQEGAEVTNESWKSMIKGWRDARLEFSQINRPPELDFESVGSKIFLERSPTVQDLNELIREAAQSQDLGFCLQICKYFNLFPSFIKNQTSSSNASDTSKHQHTDSFPLDSSSIPAPTTETYAILCQFLGRLRRPALTLRCFKEALDLPVHTRVRKQREESKKDRLQGKKELIENGAKSGFEANKSFELVELASGDDADHSQEIQFFRQETRNLQKCAQAVILGFLASQRPKQALGFGALVLGRSTSYIDDSPLTVNFGLKPSQLNLVEPGTLIYSSLLQATANPQVRSVKAARNVLEEMFSWGFISNGPIRRGLATLIFSSIGKETDVQDVRKSFQRLKPMVLNENSWSRSERFHGEKKPIFERGRSRASRRRIGMQRMEKLAQILQMNGFEQAIELSNRKKGKARAKLDEVQIQEDPLASLLDDGSTQDMSHTWAKDNQLGPGSDPIAWGSISGSSASTQFSTEPSTSLDPSSIPTSNGFALRLRVYAVLRGDVESAISLYRLMERCGIKPNSHHISPIIEGLTRSGRRMEAKALMNAAQKHLNVEPSVEVRMTFIEMSIKNKDQLSLAKDLKEFRESGLKVMNNRLRNLLEAFKLIRNKEESGFREGGEWEFELGRLWNSNFNSDSATSRSGLEISESKKTPASSFSPTLVRKERFRGDENTDPYLFHSRFWALNGQNSLLSAQNYLARSLHLGLKPTKPIIEAFYRSGNWIKKNLKESDLSKVDPTVKGPWNVSHPELEQSLEIFGENCKLIGKEEERMKRDRLLEKEWRERAVDLVLGVVNGDIRREGLRLALERDLRSMKGMFGEEWVLKVWMVKKEEVERTESRKGKEGTGRRGKARENEEE